MNADYLDLLLTRETRAAPLAEPRILTGAETFGVTPVWEEVTKEKVAPSRYPVSAENEGMESEVLPQRMETAVRPENVTVFPPPHQEWFERTATLVSEVLREQDQTAPANHVDRTRLEREIRETTLREQAPRIEPAETPVKAAEPAAQTAPAEHLYPPAWPLEPGSSQSEASVQPKNPAPKLVALQSKIPAQLADPTTKLPSPQSVTIRIDRVEVRAGVPATSSASQSRGHASPRLSLEEYLQRRTGGGR